MPDDSAKLRISSRAFQYLIGSLRLPASFIYAITQHHLPCGRGFRSAPAFSDCASVHELWYLLPVRAQFKCNDKAKAHSGNTAGSNQMDPFHYLHLPNAGLDIRGSHIANFCRYDSEGHTMIAVSINFMDGRWSRSVLEPKKRIREGWNMQDKLKMGKDPFYYHLIYFSSALRWWTNALSSINDQLIANVSGS